MRRHSLLWFLMFILLLLPAAVWAEGLSFTVTPDMVRPGKTERISFESPVEGTARLEILDAAGQTVSALRDGLSVAAGVNHLTWDGTDAAGQALPAGEYTLVLTVHDQTIRKTVSIGEPSPQILSVSAADAMQGLDPWQLTVRANLPGTLTLRIKASDGEWLTILEDRVPAGESTHTWDGSLNGARIPEGNYPVQLKLTDETGFSGTVQQVFLTVVQAITPSPAPTPRLVIPSAVSSANDDLSYWTLPVGEMNEAAIWEVMMQPIIVLDGKDQRDVYPLRAEPDNSAKKIGEITYTSQGVHVLETLDNGWSKVEVYNSSYGPKCTSRRGYGVTDDLLQGYLKTSLLKTITPREDYALLIDKLEQKMYIFSEGKCIGSLLVSTGLNNDKQTWNETPSGEFLMVSRMGGFPAGNLWCAYGMRINGGCAIHEVPYIGNDDTPAASRDYSSTVKQLGKKASHGCIRVQKTPNAEGQSIKWLWNNIKVNTKVLIWDDTGRFMAYPDDETPLYYNPDGGKYFHEEQNCPSVKSRFLPLKEFRYGELETGAFAKLSPCPACAKIMRKGEIDAINRENGFN